MWIFQDGGHTVANTFAFWFYDVSP